MKYKVFLSTFFLLILGVFNIACTNKTILNTPSKILIYSNENIKEINSDNSAFNEIVNMTNNRFNNDLTIIQDVVNDDYINKLKKEKLSIEFIYDNEQKIDVQKQTIKYDRLFFPLIPENNEDNIVETFQYGNKDGYNNLSEKSINHSIGSLKKSDKLIEKIKQIN